MWKKCVGDVGCGSCVEEDRCGCGDDDEDNSDNDTEAKTKPMPSFAIVLHAYESMRALLYAHITKRDQANIMNTGNLLFGLKRKSATKEMKINDTFKKKLCRLDWTVGKISLMYVF
jgi:hypothetical protein